MKLKMLSFLFISAFLMSSCKKDYINNDNLIPNGAQSSNRTTLDMLVGYHSFMVQNADATIRTGSWPTMSTQDTQYRSFYADGAFRDITNKIQDVKIGDVSLVQDVNNANNLTNTNSTEVKSIYGTNALFTFKDAENIIRSRGLYIPKAISIASADNQLTGIPLKVGNTITWNKDALNAKGVIFIIRYDPQISPETRKDFPVRIDKSFAVDDTGSYTFKTSDLSGFPLNAYVDFNVGRAGYEVYKPENSSKTYRLYGYSMVSAMGVIK